MNTTERKEKRSPECQECKQQTNELFEKLGNSGIAWVCKDCKPLRYGTLKGEIKEKKNVRRRDK